MFRETRLDFFCRQNTLRRQIRESESIFCNLGMTSWFLGEWSEIPCAPRPNLCSVITVITFPMTFFQVESIRFRLLWVFVVEAGCETTGKWIILFLSIDCESQQHVEASSQEIERKLTLKLYILISSAFSYFPSVLSLHVAQRFSDFSVSEWSLSKRGVKLWRCDAEDLPQCGHNLKCWGFIGTPFTSPQWKTCWHQVSVRMENCREIAKTGLENWKTQKTSHTSQLSCVVTSPFLTPGEGAGVPTFGQSRAKTGAS